jgi:RHS repeat-associated protein
VQWDNFSGLGLTYMHARHYSPLTGRFLQPDPAAAEANHFAYGGSSPVSHVDPCGTRMVTCGFWFLTFRATEAECEFCKWPWNWTMCYNVLKLADKAHRETLRIYGHARDNTRANAFKHCFWSAMIANWYGSPTARGFTNRHEQEPPERRSNIGWTTTTTGKGAGWLTRNVGRLPPSFHADAGRHRPGS